MELKELISKFETLEAAMASLLGSHTALEDKVGVLEQISLSGKKSAEGLKEVKEKILPTLPPNAKFKVGEITYELLMPAVNIPGIGYRDADEILMDKEAQRALVALKSGAVRSIV